MSLFYKKPFIVYKKEVEEYLQTEKCCYASGQGKRMYIHLNGLYSIELINQENNVPEVIYKGKSLNKAIKMFNNN